MMLKVTFDTETFNEAVRDGSAGQKMGRILEEIQPEAAYFIEENGKRTGVLFVDMAETSGIPALAEPWFLHFNAGVEIHPAMTPEDLRKGDLDEMGKKWG
jgi:hypothetical protein